MEDKNVINIPEGTKELIIRHGETIDPKEQLPLRFKGLLDSPTNYLKARAHLLNPDSCNIVVNKHDGTLTFTSEERDHYRNVIEGGLKKSNIIKQLGINSSTIWSDKELAKFFKRNRFYFNDPIICNNIIASLLNLQAKVNVEIEKKQDQKGNLKNLFERTVESNLPDSFMMKAAIYEGYEPVVFEVFIGAEANNSEVKFFLESPILFEIEEKEKEFHLQENVKVFSEFGCAILYV